MAIVRYIEIMVDVVIVVVIFAASIVVFSDASDVVARDQIPSITIGE